MYSNMFITILLCFTGPAEALQNWLGQTYPMTIQLNARVADNFTNADLTSLKITLPLCLLLAFTQLNTLYA